MTDAPGLDPTAVEARAHLLKAAQALGGCGRKDLEENVRQIVQLMDTPDSEPVIVQNLHI